MEIRYPPISLIPFCKSLAVKIGLSRERVLSSIISHPPGNYHKISNKLQFKVSLVYFGNIFKKEICMVFTKTSFFSEKIFYFIEVFICINYV